MFVFIISTRSCISFRNYLRSYLSSVRTYNNNSIACVILVQYTRLDVTVRLYAILVGAYAYIYITSVYRETNIYEQLIV